MIDSGIDLLDGKCAGNVKEMLMIDGGAHFFMRC